MTVYIVDLFWALLKFYRLSTPFSFIVIEIVSYYFDSFNIIEQNNILLMYLEYNV